jgi:O-antigen ligase
VALVVGLAVSISLAQIALALLAGWVLLARRAGLLPRLRWPLLVPLAAFAAWTVVATLASEQPAVGAWDLKHLLSLGALLVIVNALPAPEDGRRFARWLLVAVTGAAVLGLVQVAACPGPDATGSGTVLVGKFLRKCTRARAFYSIYMTLAGVLAMSLVFALPRLARLGRDARWLTPAWLAGGGALAFTYVRGAWLGFAAGAVVVVAGLGRRGLIAATVMILVVLGLGLGLPTVRARLQTIGDPNNDTTRDRMAMMIVGFEIVRTHPLVGIGLDGVKRVYPSLVPPEGMRRSTSHLHNTPLQIAAERGVIGLAAWLWIFVAFFRRAGAVWRRLPEVAADDRALVLGSLAAVVTFLVAGLFEYNFGDTEVLMVALTLMALPFTVVGDRAAADACVPA